MTDHRERAARMAQHFEAMQDRKAERSFYRTIARALFWVALSLITILATRALGVAATVQVPTF